MKPWIFVLALILVTLSFQTQYVPIPKTNVGIPFGATNGQISIELIYDPVCFDTRDFDVKIVRALQAQLPKEVINQISWRIVGQAKPWHLTAHKIIQAINLVRDQKGNEQALSVFRYFLDHISSWDNSFLQTNTINQFMDQLAAQVSTLSGIPKENIRPQLTHYSNYDGKARYEFKHSIGNRYSGLNPTIYVNGAKVDNGLNIDYDGWKKLIMGLIN